MNKATIKIGEDEETFQLKDKTFRTGSTGFYGFGKLFAKGGKRYQVSINVVLIGSKPSS